MCRINPRVDFAFKKLFGTEENKDLLIDFINSIVSEEDRVYDLTIKTPYNAQSFKNDKLSILDIKAQDSRGKWFNIEMQIIDQDYFAQRSLYYWARFYTGQLVSGVNYDNLQKTISINILNFNCIDEAGYHNVYRLQNSKSGKTFLNHLEINFIELGKYDESVSTLLDRWVNFLKKAEAYDKNRLPKELAEIPTIKKAMEILDKMSLDEEEREVYEARLKWLRDEEMAIITAEKRGKAEGLAEGRAEGIITVAQNMLELGITHEIVMNATGLTAAEIDALQKKSATLKE